MKLKMEENTIYLTCNDKLLEVRSFLSRFFSEKHDWGNHDGWISFVMPATGFILNLMDGSGQGMKKTQNVAIEISFGSLAELQNFAKKHSTEVQSFDTHKTRAPYTYHYCEIKGPDNICFIEGNFSSEIGKSNKIDSKKKVGVFIDASNTYFSEKRAGWKIDYSKLKKIVEEEFELITMRYYVAIPDKNKDTDMHNAKMKYINKIKDVVDIVKKPIKYISESVKVDNKYINRLIRKGDIDVDLSVDILDVCSNLDVIIILSGDSDYVALRDDLLRKGKKVLFVAHRPNLSHEIKQGKYVTLKSIRKFIELGTVKTKQTPAHGGRTLVNILYTKHKESQSKINPPR